MTTFNLARTIAAGCLVTGLAFANSASAEALAGGSGSPGGEKCPRAVADGPSATLVAVRCGTDAEVVSARTEWSTTVAQPDGKMRLDVSTGAVRAKKAGKWVDVDNEVVPAGGALSVAAAVAPMTFSDGAGDEPFATIQRDGHELTFDMPFDLPKPTVDGPQLTYAEVLPGVDLVVTVNEDATGFSEVLRVDSPEAAADPRLRDLTFPLETSGGIDVAPRDGGFVAADAKGKAVFTSPVPSMWDSSVAKVSSTRPDAALGAKADLADPSVEAVGDEQVVTIPAEVSSDEVSIAPDATMLTSDDTVWPVYIDPGVSGSLNRRSAVRTAVGIKYNFDGDEGVGLCSTATSSTCSTTFKSRLLWQFAGLQSIGDLDAADIDSATFAVTGTHSYSCTPQPVTLYAVADFDQNTAYPGGTYWSPLQTLTIAHRAGCPAGQEPRRIEFDAKAQAQAVANANTGLASFGMAADEGSMAYWKRYGWDASFSVTYNRPPSTPTSVRTTNPDSSCAVGDGVRPYVRSATPTLRAVLGDPDGGNVQASFTLAEVGQGVAWAPTTAAQGSGAEHAVTVPAGLLREGGSYRWSVRGYDGAKFSAPVECEFTVDTQKPLVPGVTPVAGMPAVYVEGPTGSGGVGVEGRFTFSNGDSTDVAWYRYSFQGAAQKVTPVGSPTVAFAPTLIGPQTLTVESVDRAGAVSDPRVYRFTVAWGNVSNAWQLDEASGASAANVRTGGVPPLAVSGSVTRTNGLGKDFRVRNDDLALQFDSTADTASTAGPAVLTDRPFSVMANVKLDDVTGTYTAVSQDGSQVSGFELGHRVDPRCPEGTNGHCWAFWMPGNDSGAAPVVVLSAVPARAGSWVQLTGIRDAANGGTLRLAVCELGVPPTAPRAVAPVEAPAQAAPAPWLATGPLQVGRGRDAGSPARSWHGAVSQVRTYSGAAAAETLKNSCQLPWVVATNSTDAPTTEPPPNPAPLPAPKPGTAGFNAAYSSSVFKDLMRREPSFQELVNMTGWLDSGQPVAFVPQQLVGSEEWRRLFIGDLYRQYLKRGADEGGTQTWLAAMAGGADTYAIELGFVNSAEYYNRAGGTDAGLVAALYADALGRPAGQSEIDYWLNVIAANGRGAATNGIVMSQEHTNRLVDTSYRSVLGRGMDAAAPTLPNGRVDTLVVILAASDEYQLYRVRAV